MSKVDYSIDIPDPTYEFGNSREIHEAIKAALIRETTDIANSNFINTNAGSEVQVINRKIVFNDPEALNDDENDTSKTIASKEWVKQNLKTLSYTTSGRVCFTNKIVLGDTAAIVCPNGATNIFIEGSELKQLEGVNNNIQTQLNERVNVWESNQNIWGTKLFNDKATFQHSTNRPQILNSSLVNDSDIVIKSDIPNLISGKQNTITDNSLTISKTSGLQLALDSKQNTISSLNPINEDSVLNLTSDLSARPTLNELNNGSLNLSINTLTVDNLISTNQVIQYQEINLLNNQVPQVKIENLVTDLGTINTSITNLSNVVDTKAFSSDLTPINTSISGIQTDVSSIQTDLTNLTLTIGTKASSSSVNIINDSITTINSNISTLQTDLTNLSGVVDTKCSIAYADSLIMSGPQGIQGIQGIQGDTGPQGIQGIQGIQGDTGPQGIQGIQGLPGTNGTNGTNGIDGAQGIQGIQGIQGLPGVDGINGTNGTNGIDGVDGFLSTIDEDITGIKTFLSPPILSGASITTSTINQSSVINLPSNLTTINNSIDTLNTAIISKVSTTDFNTQLGLKQNTLTNGSITDSLLSSTFLKPNTNFTSGSITVNSVSERFTSINQTSTNAYTLNYSATNTNILIVAPTANFSIRMNECGTDIDKNISFCIIYKTTGKYYCNSVSAYTDSSTAITLSSTTPLWPDGKTPIISSSVLMVQTFTLIRNFETGYCFSNVGSYANA